jgi:hypothetical protein
VPAPELNQFSLLKFPVLVVGEEYGLEHRRDSFDLLVGHTLHLAEKIWRKISFKNELGKKFVLSHIAIGRRR